MGDWSKDRDAIHLLSCVGSIEMMGYTEVPSKSLMDQERERHEAILARRRKGEREMSTKGRQ